MKIYASKESIELALEKVNEEFDGNVRFKRFERFNGRCFTVTLTVNSSRKAGAKVNYWISTVIAGKKPRRIHAACWHVHGKFFDHLPLGTKIVSNGSSFTSDDTWEDFNWGNTYYPMSASEWCDCGREGVTK